jgi:pantetheine-phosphate adenylyltransferase
VPDLDAILVSSETLLGAARINELRRWRGLNELEVIHVELVMAEDGKPVSTTRIRSGEIDREGRVLPC